MKIAAVILATGKYTQFVPALIASIRKLFLPGHERIVYLCSDIYPRGGTDFGLECEALPSPLPNLMKFHYLLQLDLRGIDAVYMFDADTRVESAIGEEVLPDTTGLVLARHLCSPALDSFEDNPKSLAYVAPELQKVYYQTCFMGGSFHAFMAMAEHIDVAIRADLKNRIIAKWFDESHVNRYASVHPVKALHSGYAFMENSNDRNEKKILHFNSFTRGIADQH